MSISAPFIHRPVGTTLLTLAIGLAGAIAYALLPVSPLPQVEFPTINISAALPGASPDTMASAVATPLERQFGRIAGITEMTSTSYLGTTSITLQFDLNRNIDAAARDVQAAINAARSQLPANLPSNPSYRKVNPADAPILILSLTSDIFDRGPMYDAASTILAQKLSQVSGVGQVTVGGGALPAVRVEMNPLLLNALGVDLEDVRNALKNANANRPKGAISDASHTWTLSTTDQLNKAKEYRPLIVAYRGGAAVRLGDVADVQDSVEDVRAGGILNGQPAVMLIIFRQPGANIIDTVDRVISLVPQFQASIPAAMHLAVALDRTTTIRASVRDVEMSLGLSICLVVLVVFLFLRDFRTTLIPSVAVPVSLIGTFGVMYLAGYSLDNLSLMALAIATGFVVDDAIVVIENISRHLELGATPMQAALRGAAEIGFTVVSISISLVAVFIPILMMGGIVGRLFREFAVTLSVAIGVSLVVSLTTTPMMCAALLRGKHEENRGRLFRASERGFELILAFYERTLSIALRHHRITALVTLATMVVTVFLYVIVPKGFFPQQDTGRLTASLQADQAASSVEMRRLLREYSAGVSADPAVENVIASTGGRGSANTAQMFITLKPISERGLSADYVIPRISRSLSKLAGAKLGMQPVQDLRIGGRPSALLYQYTFQSDSTADLNEWAPKVGLALAKLPAIAEVQSDQLDRGLEAGVTIDRAAAGRVGITPNLIDGALYDAFGQRQVSTMYTQLNQYHVVMEAAPEFWQNPEGLRTVYIRGSGGEQVPLGAFASNGPSMTSLAVNHSAQSPSVTISFNLKPGVALGDAVKQIEAAELAMGLPASMHGSFQGTAQAFQASLSNMFWLLLAALAAVYIVLGILYESLIHPVTILSTIPSAGVGACLALLATKTDLSVIAGIGLLLLVGIVKKNAIMMIDFALDAERNGGKSPQDAIFQACVLRFRPITMTTMAALFGALPLALGTGTGAELRRPLGIAIVGGLLFSQMLTLYTTPVVYLYMDWMRLWFRKLFGRPEEHPHAPSAEHKDSSGHEGPPAHAEPSA